VERGDIYKVKRKMILVVVVSLIFIILAGIAYSTGLSPAARAKNQLSLGNKYLQEGKYQEAILAFQKVIEIEPMNIPARLGLGKIYVATKEFNKAEIILKEVVGIDQKNITAREDLFNIYLSEGNNEEAEKILKEAILIKADLPELYLDLGNLYLKMNKIDQAINILSDGYKITKVLKIKELLEDPEKLLLEG
jgi:tetratricopeptide (TPR) repeat protein